MTSALKFYAAVMMLSLGVIISSGTTPATAADLAPQSEQEPRAPLFFVHAGAIGSFFETNGSRTGGGLFTASNIAIRPVYTLALELGYFITPNIALALSTGVPPIERYKATGFPMTGLYGTNLQGSTRAGLAMGLLQYHFTQFGAIQPYVGAGVGYGLVFANISDGILTDFSVDQNFGLALQAGADYMLTENWGVFVDGKKLFYSTDGQGLVVRPGTFVPVRSHLQLDPWLATVGITFKY